MQTVVIDGVTYVPRNTVISDETMQALAGAFGEAWANGYYDPPANADFINQIFRNIADKLQTANKELQFKR